MWISQIAISKSTKRGFRKQPLVFTEYGVAMVSAVLRSQIAIETSIHIVKAFIEYRKGKIQDHFVDVDKMVTVGIRKRPNSTVFSPTLFLS